MFVLGGVHDKIKPKDCQVASPLVIQGFSHFLRVVSSDYGKPRTDIAKSGILALLVPGQ